MFTSCPSNWWRQMFGFRRYIRLLPRLIWRLQGRPQSLSPRRNPNDNAEPCFPRDKIVGDHMCDECRLSNEPNVGHRLLSTWLIEQVCLLTEECQVYQFVPSASISRQSASILWTFSKRFQFFLFELMIIPARNGDFVQLLCLFVRQFTISFNTLFRMSFHII